ncbi:MAG: hypothetical protein KJ995_01990 [Candidatus Omnitrophica bacterium]|nr:hypothetical protein [Candidatus Omnitrophota bacterium]MBU1128045.1 hypothetical protein [Candidatus Omnitrophota bacterium]MBU1657372.1 hypothetical protein [Candidatus Omnitrophota bacterium]MBU1784632.1 hypothetical protein [Candidatus Omnitrophota bacterium]MBU1851162.1 hypothetical protein [Candidatus Omnitrophota bacterium]
MTVGKKTLWIIAAILICVILLGGYHDRRTCWGSNDFDTFYFAGGLAASGKNLYTHQAFKTTLSPFLHLPFFAVLVAPLSFIHIRLAAVVLYCLQAFRFMQVLGAGCFTIVLLWILFIGMLRKEKN